MLGYDQALHNGRRITVLSGFAALSTVVQEKATEKSVAFYRSWPLHPKGGIAMFFTVTFHVRRKYSVSITVHELKSRNRHSAK